MKNNDVKFSLPLLPEPRPIRVKFRKVGDLQYISHLDLQRTFSRVLVRAGLPLWYTQGFNPHIKMVFGLPLPVGCESECEFLDLRLARVKKACDEYGAILCVTADHGNADQMLEKNKKGKISVRTAHSLNPVPFIVYDKDERHELKDGHGFGLANVAPTVAGLLGIKPFDSWEESMLK